MRAVPLVMIVMLALSCLSLQAETKDEKVAVTGKLTRAMAIGAETTGWTIELDAETTIAGKAMHAIEIAYPKSETLEQLVNQHVRAKGKVGHRQGVETGDRIVLEVSSIKAVKTP
jgi:hypothetical protein